MNDEMIKYKRVYKKNERDIQLIHQVLVNTSPCTADVLTLYTPKAIIVVHRIIRSWYTGR